MSIHEKQANDASSAPHREPGRIGLRETTSRSSPLKRSVSDVLSNLPPPPPYHLHVNELTIGVPPPSAMLPLPVPIPVPTFLLRKFHKEEAGLPKTIVNRVSAECRSGEILAM